MIDFSWTSLTLSAAIYCLLAYTIFIIMYKRKYTLPLKITAPTDKWLYLYALILVVTICIDDDWYHYQQMMEDYDFVNRYLNHGEVVYSYIAEFVNRNYLLFRIVVWGSALYICKIIFQRCRINVNAAIFFIIAVFLLRFNYARATLAMAIYFLGLSFLIYPIENKKFLSIVMALLLIGCSFFFHSSIAILIALTFLIYVPINKYIIIFISAGLPLLGYYLTDYINAFVLSGMVEDEYLSQKMVGYVEQVADRANIFGIVADFIGYGVFFCAFISSFISIFKHKKLIDGEIWRLFKLTFFLLIVASSILFTSLASQVFFYRFLFMSFIPLTVIFVYLYENKYLSRQLFLLVFYWGILSNGYRFLYMLYKVLNGTYNLI